MNLSSRLATVLSLVEVLLTDRLADWLGDRLEGSVTKRVRYLHPQRDTENQREVKKKKLTQLQRGRSRERNRPAVAR